MEKNLDQFYSKEKMEMYSRIIQRAKDMNLIETNDIASSKMDIMSADYTFNLRLEEWLNADEFNFIHDFCGIKGYIKRNEFPSTQFNGFLPRFAKEHDKNERIYN